MPTTATTLTASHAINRYCSRLLTFSSLSQAALNLLSSASKDASVISSRCDSFLPNVSLSLSKLLCIPLVTSPCDYSGTLWPHRQFRDVCLIESLNGLFQALQCCQHLPRLFMQQVCPAVILRCMKVLHCRSFSSRV